MSHSSKTPSMSSRAPSDALSHYSADGRRNDGSDHDSQASNWSNHSNHRARRTNTPPQDLSRFIRVSSNSSFSSLSQDSSRRRQSSNPVNQHRSTNSADSGLAQSRRQHAAAGSSRQHAQHAAAGSSRQHTQHAAAGSSRGHAAAGSSRQHAAAGSSRQNAAGGSSRQHAAAGPSRDHAQDLFPKGKPEWVPDFIVNQYCNGCEDRPHVGTTIRAIMDHLNDKHGGGLQVCDKPQCFQVCKFYRISAHSQVHGRNAKYKCKICDASFPNRGVLAKHRKGAHRYKL